MPAKEIKELRQSAKLEEALAMAKAEWEAEPDNVWCKRNISWVYVDYLKAAIDSGVVADVFMWLETIRELDMPETEDIFWNSIEWQAGKVAFLLAKEEPVDSSKASVLLNHLTGFYLPKPGEGYSFLFRGLHKLLKATEHYLRFADWWGFESFLPKDFEKEPLPNGKEVMSIVEQAYITYAKHLLARRTSSGEVLFDREKAIDFIDRLKELSEKNPAYQYPPYFQAKLLLALGNRDNILDALLPFAKKKQNDFWVWEVIAEAFPGDSEKVFACYCKALLCNAPEEMLVSLRQKFARLLIQKELYDEAYTEIVKITDIKNKKGHKTSPELNGWVFEGWFQSAQDLKTNDKLYKQYAPIAEAILFQDIPEELVVAEFVNRDKKILNFIASDEKFGFFKYGRFLKDVRIGDVLSVRFQQGGSDGRHQVLTAVKVDEPNFRVRFVKEVNGEVRIGEGKSFGFVEDVYVSKSVIDRLGLRDKMIFNGTAMKTYNPEKKQWGWKVVSIK